MKKDGYITFVHPNGWRKPNTEKSKMYGLFEKMTKEASMMYVEIHDVKDGMKTFNCGTRYDWYVIRNTKNKNCKTIIIDQEGKNYEINLNKYNWLANCELDLIDKIIAEENEERCEILFSSNNYAVRRNWMSKEETDEYKYPVIHSTPKDGKRIVWSSRNDNGFYGISKVIFGDSGINNPIIDTKGKYALSEHAMAIKIMNKKEGILISDVLESLIFKKILKACLWSSFQLDWRLFLSLKKDFHIVLNELNKDYKDSINNTNTITLPKKKLIKKKT